MDFLLTEDIYHKWKRGHGIYTRGWAEFKGEIYHDLTVLFDKNMDENQFVNTVKILNGNFSLIVETDTSIFAAVDNVSSLQIYYSLVNESLVISDSMQLIKNKYNLKLDDKKKQEFYASGFITGNATVTENIYQLQAGQILIYSKTDRVNRIIDYYLHVHHPIKNQDTKYLCNRLEKTISNVINRLIRSIDGKTIVLFLSGGYDSKLILSTLDKINYRNVVCVSLGGFDTKDVAVAKVIAEKLHYKWIRVDVSQKTWKAFRKSAYFETYFKKVSAYSAYPYLQGITIKQLIEEGVIPQDCVVITGNSGDAIEGQDVTHKFQTGSTYKIDDIRESIRNKHYMLNGFKESLKAIYEIDVSRYVKYVTDKVDNFTDEECEDIFELFNWRERQSKYVVSDIHNYEDLLNVDWRLPLWDKEFQDFWLGVCFEQRYDRKLYYQFVKAELLPSANTISFGRKVFNFIKDKLGVTLYCLYIPKSIWNYFFSTKFYYATYGLISLDELFDILKSGVGNREPHMEGIVRLIYSYY